MQNADSFKTICKRSGDFRIIGAIIGLTALFTGWYFFTSEIGTPFVQDTNQYIWLVAIVFG